MDRHTARVSGKVLHRFYELTKFFGNHGVVQKKTNRGRMTWIVQTNEKIIFFFKSNDKKHKNGRFSPTEQIFF